MRINIIYLYVLAYCQSCWSALGLSLTKMTTSLQWPLLQRSPVAITVVRLDNIYTYFKHIHFFLIVVVLYMHVCANMYIHIYHSILLSKTLLNLVLAHGKDSVKWPPPYIYIYIYIYTDREMIGSAHISIMSAWHFHCDNLFCDTLVIFSNSFGTHLVSFTVWQ